MSESVSHWVVECCVEPILKLVQEHGDASELDKPEKIEGIVLPANENEPFPL